MAFTTRFKRLLTFGERTSWNICQRCGVPVTDGEKGRHASWHRQYEDRSPGDASASGAAPCADLADGDRFP